MTDVSHETLMRYLDGEVAPGERARIEAAVAGSTELQRDMAVFGAMKKDLQSMTFALSRDHSVWGTVHRRLSRPIGWLFVLGGFTTWAGYASYLYLVSAIDPWEKLATSAIAVGVLLLLVSVIYERYKESLTDPYRDVYR